MLQNKLSRRDLKLVLLRWKENEGHTNRIQYEEYINETKADFKKIKIFETRSRKNFHIMHIMSVDVLIVVAGLSTGVTPSAFNVGLHLGSHIIVVTHFDVNESLLVINEIVHKRTKQIHEFVNFHQGDAVTLQKTNRKTPQKMEILTTDKVQS